MNFGKKKETCEIVIPTLYNGSYTPSEPRNLDIWQNSYKGELKVFSNGKWFKVFNTKETGYTKQEELEMQADEAKESQELKRIKNKLLEIKNFFDGLENEV